jgi:hypothetical protein
MVSARYLQVRIGDPTLSILFASKMQYAMALAIIPYEFNLPSIPIFGWDGR